MDDELTGFGLHRLGESSGGVEALYDVDCPWHRLRTVPIPGVRTVYPRVGGGQLEITNVVRVELK